MGVHTVEALLRAGFRVSVLNRGKTASPFSERPEVSHIVADRFAERARVKRAITALGPWYAIVDFVAFAAVHERDEGLLPQRLVTLRLQRLALRLLRRVERFDWRAIE